MLPLVRIKLTARVQDVVTVFPDAVDVIANTRKAASVKLTFIILHELLEAVASQLFVFDMVAFVFLFKST